MAITFDDLRGATQAALEMRVPRFDPTPRPRIPGSGIRLPRPFLKCVGGKTRLLPELLKRVPPKFGRYWEPCVGGGALFFALARAGRLGGGAVLGDDDDRLVLAYRGVRDDVDGVVAALGTYASQHARKGREFFTMVRNFPIGKDPTCVAAWRIYLSKTAYNGLYRVNKRGGFNATFGNYDEPKILDEENLRACSRALTGVEVTCGDCSATVSPDRSGPVPGDFTYFDPPYVPASKTASFTGYTASGFGEREQRRLASRALELKERGVHVLLSNSDAPLVRELYPEDRWRVEVVHAGRSVSCKGGGRGRVAELLIS